MPKITFFFFNVTALLMGLYKMNTMGLLPTTTSDWAAFMEPKIIKEVLLD